VIDEAWDLPNLREHYETFIDDFAPARPRSPEATFATQTAIVHAWRRFPFIDPDLPDDLLPSDWPRRRAHELFSERHERWTPLAQQHFEALA
jgi:phenylacetic acid degradation operon negative regulatory protein